MQKNRQGKLLFLRNLWKLPGIYFFLLKSVRKQKRFLKKELAPNLEAFRRENDGSLSEAHFKKITSYYALGVPGILGESFCVLRGFPMTEQERLCMSYLGGISGLLDDLFDEPGKSAHHLQEFIFEPEKLIPVSTHENLLKEFYLKGLSYSSHPDKIKKLAIEVYKAQERSLQQKTFSSRENIEEFTFIKGGSSFLYYRLCLDNDLNEKEKEMIFQLGALLQLGNDIFDVWEDSRDGIATIATITSDIRVLRAYFSQKLRKINDLLRSTGFKNTDKKKFRRMIHLAIARVFVCLDQFEKLECAIGGQFLVQKYSRKQLICDMQKPGNQLKAIDYYLRMPAN